MKKSILAFGTLLAATTLLTACSNSSDNGGEKVDDKKSSKVEKKAKPSLYKVGDTVKVGDATYKLVSVVKTDERNELEEKQPANVIKVTYHVVNNSKKDLSVGGDLDVYGPDNTKLETYPLDITLDAIAPGKEMDAVAAFGTEKLGKFELQFAPLISTEKPAKFEAEVK